MMIGPASEPRGASAKLFLRGGMLALLLVLADGSPCKPFSWHLTRNITQKDGVWSLAFSPDGKTLAGGCFDHQVRLWDIATGRLKQTLRGHTWGINTLTFAPDGSWLVSGNGGTDNTVRVWNPKTSKLLHTLTGFKGTVYSVAASPDNKTLATCNLGRGGALRFWNARTGQLIRTVKALHLFPTYAVFSPHGRTLAFTGGQSGQDVRLFDVHRAQIQKVLNCRDIISPHDKNFDFSLSEIAYSPDGRLLVGVTADGSLAVWNTRTWHAQWSFRHPAANYHFGAAIAFSPGGKILASLVHRTQTITLRDAKTGGVKSTLTLPKSLVIEGGYDLAYSPDGKRLVCATDKGYIEFRL